MPPDSSHSRLAALDGLRGIAAVIVVLGHALLTTTFSDAYVDRLHGKGSDPVAAVLADTPLRAFFAGNEAVVVFFVLSGFVLTLPMLRGKNLDLWAYYPRRTLRLWVPVAAAVLLAAVIILITPQNPAIAPSQWVKDNTFAELDPRSVLRALMVITGDPAINSPLWSIEWEMLFSLLLPIAYLLVARLNRFYWTAIIAIAVVSGCGVAASVNGIKYLPMFLAGCIAAKLVHSGALHSGALRSWLLILGGVALIAIPDLTRVLHMPFLVRTVSYATVTIGATMIVLGLTMPSGLTRLFGSAPGRFLGRISFSLYLVHLPVMIGVLYTAPALGDMVLLISIPASFLVAWLFTRFVEEPATRLARHVGERVSSPSRVQQDQASDAVR